MFAPKAVEHNVLHWFLALSPKGLNSMCASENSMCASGARNSMCATHVFPWFLQGFSLLPTRCLPISKDPQQYTWNIQWNTWGSIDWLRAPRMCPGELGRGDASPGPFPRAGSFRCASVGRALFLRGAVNENLAYSCSRSAVFENSAVARGKRPSVTLAGDLPPHLAGPAGTSAGLPQAGWSRACKS